MFSRLNDTLALFVITLCLMGLGLIMVYSTAAALTVKNSYHAGSINFPVNPPSLVKSLHSTYFLKRQAMWIGLGIILMFFFYTLKQEQFFAISAGLLGFSILMLVLVLIPPFGNRVHGAMRWIRLPGGFGFQPSELAKVSLVLFTGLQIGKMHKDKIHNFWKGVLVLLAPLVIISALMIKEPDFGGTIVLCMIIFALLFAGGVKLRHLILLCIVALLALGPILMTSDYRRRRVMEFFFPEKYGAHANYQLEQSLLALGSGGIFGRGLGESNQKYHFLSEAHTDFIFSIIGEEMGFAGTMALVLLYLALFIVGLRIAWGALEFRASIIALGMVLMILIPAIINMMVATKSGPAKGLALPFISYGGSSLIANSIAIGVLMNVSRSKKVSAPRRKKNKS